MEIRRLVQSDWEAFRSIRLEALEESPEALAADLEEEAEIPDEKWPARLRPGDDSFVLGVFAEERIVGCAGFRRESRRKLRHKGHIWGVYVSPASRGGGIARKLLTALLREARGLEGLEQVSLTVVTDNLPAKQLYKRLGFQVFGTELRALKIGQAYVDEDHMVLFLHQPPP